MNADSSASWIQASWPAPPGIRALTTTRGTNVGNRNGEDSVAVATSRRLVHATTLGNAGHLQWLNQVHGNDCFRADADSCRSQPQADAAWTEQRGVGLAIQSADCVPVTLATADGQRIGAAHGGWRGLTGGVIESLVAAMRSDGFSAPLIAWIGPAIGPEAYEVGEDVHAAVRAATTRGSARSEGTLPSKDVHAAVRAATTPSSAERFFQAAAQPGKWRLDLFALTDWLLRQAGVEHIACERICTWSNAHLYSHRRDGATGRMATLVWMEP